MRGILHLALVALALSLAGCGRSSDPSPPDTGARAAVREFYAAVIRRDWTAGYSLLHPDTTKGLAQAEFNRRADAYRGKLKFDPSRVAVRTCDEHGDEATARVSLSGSGGSRHTYEDTLFLRRHAGEWRVVLPPRFGS